jgi:ABC-type multidrug transport system ATPase subunit
LFDELVAAGKTILMVTHDPTVAHRCHRVIRLHDGLIASDERNARRPVEAEAGSCRRYNRPFKHQRRQNAPSQMREARTAVPTDGTWHCEPRPWIEP